MKYYIQRGLNEYGPYTLADLQRYLAQGNILPTDLTRSEGMTEWVPVSQVVGNLPLPAPPPVAPAVAPTPATVYSGAPAAAVAPAYSAVQAQAVGGPMPPDLHWALVWLIGAFSCNIFMLVWVFIEAGFVKKLKPESNHLTLIITGMVLQIGSIFIFYGGIFALAATSGSQDPPSGPIAALVILLAGGSIGGIALHIIGNFKMRSAMLEYYNSVEPINLRLSAVMTFFFSVLYFQHHFSRIAAWKRTGYLMPQQ